MGYIRSEEEADKLIEKMMNKGKGDYITQSVTFRKDNPRQMELLKKAMMSSESFSSMVREMLHREFSGDEIQSASPSKPVEETPEKKDTGNFL